MWERLLVYTVYGIPSALLTFLLILCILNSPPLLKSSFYKVYVYVLVVYLLTYVNTWVSVKPRELSSLASLYTNISYTFLPYHLFFTLQYSFFHIEQLALILMHFNRFTAIWFPFVYHKIWAPLYFRIAMFAIFAFGIGVNYENLFVTGYYVTSPTGYAVNPLNRSLQVPISWWAEQKLGHVYPFVSLLLNIGIFSKLLYFRVRKKKSGKTKSVEFNLLMICLASLFVQLALMLYIDYGTMIFDQDTWFLMLNIVSDCSTLSEAWIGLVVNEKLRKTFWQWLFPSRAITLNSIESRSDAFLRLRL